MMNEIVTARTIRLSPVYLGFASVVAKEASRAEYFRNIVRSTARWRVCVIVPHDKESDTNAEQSKNMRAATALDARGLREMNVPSVNS